VFFCPSNDSQNIDKMWISPIRTTGYIWTNTRPSGSGPDLTGLREKPSLQYHDHFTIKSRPSETELAADWLISDTSTPKTWTNINVPSHPASPYSTSHMKGTTPSGANVACFDGHVEWRAFNPANPAKATAIQQTGANAPYFWIPNP
jgi:prepilin-type processing-associated H-X9-DG protein